MDGEKPSGSTGPGDVTQLLNQMRSGHSEAASQLLPLIYGELRRLARGYMHRERRGHTLQATALVHEAYLRLVSGTDAGWQNRSHFLAIAAHVMQRILVDHARARKAAKRGAGQTPIGIDECIAALGEKGVDVLALEEALGRLRELSPRQSRIVELRYFGGMTFEEIAAVAGCSPKTAQRDWAAARVWLYRQLRGGNDDAGALAAR